MLLKIGAQWFKVATGRRQDVWTARASVGETGQRFGPEVTAETEADAVTRLTGWLEWQSEHATALEALQEAERAYHRSVTSGAFAGTDDARAAVARRAAALGAIEDARLTLDAVRARRPE